MARGVQRLREPTVGEMRDRVRFQRNSETSDGQGGLTDSWSDYALVYARVLPLSAHATFLAREVGSRTTHQITIRYSGTSGQIKRGDRAWMTDRNGERLFIVEDVRDLGNSRRWTQIDAHEDVPTENEG
jgi:SPP1 family predicted phage head-tail adaptor